MGRAAVLVWWYHIEVSIVEVSDSAFFFSGHTSPTSATKTSAIYSATHDINVW